MKRLSYLMMFAAFLMSITLVSCSDDNDYQAATKVSDNCPSVYFSNKSECFVSLSPENVTAHPDTVWSTTILAERPNGEGELTVPIVVDYKSETVEVPESVTFADGETEAEVTISYTHPDNGLNATFHIADGYANPYIEQEGTSTFKLSILIIEKLCNVTYSTSPRKSQTNLSHFAGETNEIWRYWGQNKFLWKNFLGSNVDVAFSVKEGENVTFDPNDIKSLNGEILLLDHKIDYYGYGYYFIIEDEDNWPSWTPKGQTDEVNYFYMYDASYTYSGYSFIDFAERSDDYYSGYFYGGFQVHNSWTLDGTGYIYFFFDYNI